MIPELEEIRRILLHDWDPIGVAGNAQAADEYDAYAFEIFTGLHSGATTHAIAEYLNEVVAENMGLPSDATLNKGIAERIAAVHQRRNN